MLELLKEIAKSGKHITNEMRIKLEELGFKEKCIGTGKQSKTSSLVCKIMELNNSYIKGKYYTFGLSSRKWGKGTRYYAYVKEM